MAKEPKAIDGKALDVAMKNLKGFMEAGSDTADPTYIPTGHFYLDLAISQGVSPDSTNFDISKLDIHNIGGLPQGKLVELSGAEGSGKSSLAYRVVGYAQKMGLKCFWIDAEHSFSKTLAEINGVDLKNIGVSKLMDLDDPDHLYSAEEIFDRMCELCVAGYKVIVLDSVASLNTRAELDNQIAEGGVGMGNVAQVLSRSLKKLVNYAEKHGTLVILINQLREKIGGWGNPETTPGGRALKFLASVRVKINRQFSKEGQITEQDEDGKERTIGGNSFVYIMKNRFAPPVNGAITIPIYYTKYFPEVEEIIFDAGRTVKTIQKWKEFFKWGDIKAVGKVNFLNELKARNLVGTLVEEMKAAAQEQNFILPPEVIRYEGPKPEADTKSGADNETKVSRKRKTKDSGGESTEPVEAGGSAGAGVSAE